MLSLALYRMGLLLPLVLSMLATPCMLASVPEQVLRPSLLAHGCNNSDVLAMAGFALQDLNSNRKDGYVLSLNRVNNVQEHRQASDRQFLIWGRCLHKLGAHSQGVGTQRQVISKWEMC